MPQTTAAQGLTGVNEMGILIAPNFIPGLARYPILYTHGAGSNADALKNYGSSGVRLNYVADGGVYGVSADYGGPQTWGNDVAISAMDAAYNYLMSHSKTKKGKVALCGGSMGGLNALVWAAANPDKVSCMSIYIPVIDLVGIWENNISGFRSLIDTAHGGWNTGSMASRKDPLTMAKEGKFKNFPILINYGSTDQICLPEKTEAFAAYVGSNVTMHKLAGGHAESTENQVDRLAESEFILENSL